MSTAHKTESGHTKAQSHGHGHGSHGPTSAAELPEGVNHELSDARSRHCCGVASILFVTFAVSAVLMAGLLFATVGGDWASLTNTVQEPEAQQVPPPPILQPVPDVEEDIVIAEQTERLENAGWVNRRNNTVHMPIEHAMELLVERGVNTTADEATP
ncbi:hypothetical protein HC891_12680 [Candidatus Gracilibacteria bacterium]|nr:hypothetical protein [Candidatus Gracilibacteria bacterium]